MRYRCRALRLFPPSVRFGIPGTQQPFHARCNGSVITVNLSKGSNGHSSQPDTRRLAEERSPTAVFVLICHDPLVSAYGVWRITTNHEMPETQKPNYKTSCFQYRTASAGIH